jgi:hypothetical protein
MFIFDSLLINNIILNVLYSFVITNLIIGAFILFSMSILDFNVLSIIKYMFTNGIKKVAKIGGKTILYGSGIATGVDAGFNLHGRYVD